MLQEKFNCKWKTISFCIIFVAFIVGIFSSVRCFTHSFFIIIHLVLSHSPALSSSYSLTHSLPPSFTLRSLYSYSRWLRAERLTEPRMTVDIAVLGAQTLHCNGMRYGLIIARRFPTFGKIFHSLDVPLLCRCRWSMRENSKWYMYSLCTLCIVLCLNSPSSDSRRVNTSRTIKIYIHIIYNSIEWCIVAIGNIHCSLCL